MDPAGTGPRLAHRVLRRAARADLRGEPRPPRRAGPGRPDNPSLDNYARAIDRRFLPTLLNSLRYAALTTILSLLIGYPLAYWISRYGGRNKGLLLILVMLPFWTSYLIRTYAWMIILRDNGVVNSVLQAVGLTSEPIILLNTDFSVVLGMTYGFLPFAILPLYVSIDRLDPALVGAARDLYASGRRRSST